MRQTQVCRPRPTMSAKHRVRRRPSPRIWVHSPKTLTKTWFSRPARSQKSSRTTAKSLLTQRLKLLNVSSCSNLPVKPLEANSISKKIPKRKPTTKRWRSILGLCSYLSYLCASWFNRNAQYSPSHTATLASASRLATLLLSLPQHIRS